MSDSPHNISKNSKRPKSQKKQFRGLSQEFVNAQDSQPTSQTASVEVLESPSPNPDITPTCLEENQRLSRSLLWELERNFFDQQGIQAWNSGAVPHYVTSNPTIARAYANIILAYLRDHLQHHTLNPSAPLYILELGAGCGRFAFHCLRYLQRHLPHFGSTLPPVVYVMGDFTQTNLDYWQQHSQLQPFLDSGLLDVALVDASAIHELHLCRSGDRLTSDTLQNPLIAIANYFFDCLPQDIFVLQDGQLHESLVTLSTHHPNPDFTTPDLIDHLEITFTDQETSSDYYDNPHFNAILTDYQITLTDTALLFPCAALNCLHQLHQFSQGNLLFLSADKGYSQLEDLCDRPRPRFTRHGQGFSLMVNYHAIGQYTQHLGGTWLTAPHHHSSININAFLFNHSELSFPQTQQAYAEHIATGGPDDFFALKKAIEPHYESLTLPQLLAYLRLSHWDHNIFIGCFPALISVLKEAAEAFYPDIFTAVQQTWENYFPIQEERDLAFLLGMVLYNLEYFPEALEYFQISQHRYGDDSSTLYNIAMCYYRLGQLKSAFDYIQKTLTFDPGFESARAKRIQWQKELQRRTQ